MAGPADDHEKQGAGTASDSGSALASTLSASLLPGVLMVSAAMLTLETVLPRVFAVYMASNFVFFSVSIALVGLSSGGIALYVGEPYFLRRGRRSLVDAALLFAVASVLSVWTLSLLGGALNATIDGIYDQVLGQSQDMAVLTTSIWVPSMLFVAAAGFLAAVPFFFAGTTIALAFRLAPRRTAAVYAFDLVGAGIGCTLTVVGLTWLSAPRVLLGVGILGTLAALVFLASTRESRARGAAALGLLALLALMMWKPPFDFDIHRYAYLRSFYATPLTELDHRWTPLGRVALAEREWSPPLNPEPRMRPLSLVGMDLGGLAVVETFSPENLRRIRPTSVFTDEIMEPLALPGMYGRPPREILVLMAGTGQDMLRAYSWYGDEVELRGVELNPAIFELGLQHPTANLKAFFDLPTVDMEMGDARSFVEATQSTFDMIFVSYSGATFASGTGVLSSTPQFLMTKEAFLAYLEKLNPGGTLISAETTSLPEALPHSTRTFAAALEEFAPGSDVGRHLLSYSRPGIFASRNHTIYFRDPLDREAVERIREGLAVHGLTVTYSAYSEPTYPAMQRFAEEWEEGGAGGASYGMIAGLGLRRRAEDRVHRDSHPFFYFDLSSDSPGGFLVLGYLGMTFAALSVAAFFLLVPLALSRWSAAGAASGAREPDRAGPGAFFHVAFALLGVGFMLIEVGSIQRFELFLGNPTLSLVVILAALLIFAGAGSLASQRLFADGILSIGRVGAGVVLYGLFLLWVLNNAIYRVLHLPLAAKIAIIALLLFPLGAMLGSLFPHLLGRLRGGQERYIPWAIAINGVFSVVASNLGVLIYLFFGANAVLLLGLASYGLLAVLARRATA